MENRSSHDLKKRVPETHIKQAAAELEELGVFVHWPESEEFEHRGFYFAWADADKSEIFYDRNGEYFQEYEQDREIRNPNGYRQDVHEILLKYRLVTDLLDYGTIVVYGYYDAPGCNHHSMRKMDIINVAWEKAVREGHQTGKLYKEEYWAVKRPWMEAGMPDEVHRFIRPNK